MLYGNVSLIIEVKVYTFPDELEMITRTLRYPLTVFDKNMANISQIIYEYFQVTVDNGLHFEAKKPLSRECLKECDVKNEDKQSYCDNVLLLMNIKFT